MITKIVATLFIIATFFAAAAAQRGSGLPKVGRIKDYPATGMTVGCGNLYVEREGTTNNSGDKYVFLSRGNGSDAWMNLDGRDIKLRLLRTDTTYSTEESFVVRHLYRYAGVSIIVTIRRDGEPDAEGGTKVSIMIRKRRLNRTFAAVGSSDC